MDAMYNGKFEGIGGQSNLDVLYTEYIDLSGLGETHQKTLLINIHNLEVRLTVMPALIDLQKKSFAATNAPYEPAFELFKKYGHRLRWDADEPMAFIKQLERVEIREKKCIAELDSFMKELGTLKKEGPKVNANGRQDFIKQLNRVGKPGFIDREKTDMESYSLMIADYYEELDAKAASAGTDE
jgi:hypothetical protein